MGAFLSTPSADEEAKRKKEEQKFYDEHPFMRRCSCHAWAIAGWSVAEVAQLVDTEYADVAKAIPSTGMSLNERVAKIVREVRRTLGLIENTGSQCTVYGGFLKQNDASPMHMWVVQGVYIFDTMPNAPLRRKVLGGPGTEFHPPSERRPFPEANVGRIETYLTDQQLENIKLFGTDNFVIPK